MGRERDCRLYRITFRMLATDGFTILKEVRVKPLYLVLELESSKYYNIVYVAITFFITHIIGKGLTLIFLFSTFETRPGCAVIRSSFVPCFEPFVFTIVFNRNRAIIL